MYASVTITIDIPVYPERVYRAWLDSYEHSQFTGYPAQLTSSAGTRFSTLDGQVTGVIKTLSPFDRIVQTWSAAQFPDNDPDSEVEITLEPTCTGAELRLVQRGVAANDTRRILQWWDETYLRPLRAYFDELVGEYVADMGDG